MRLVADGLYNDDIKQKLEDLENDKTNLNVRLNRLKNISNNKTLDRNDIIKVINFDIDKLSIKNLLNKYINKVIVDYPNLEIHFKFSSNIDNSVKEAKKNERDNSSVYMAPLVRESTNIRKDQQILNFPVCLAPQVGLEPTTHNLKLGFSWLRFRLASKS